VPADGPATVILPLAASVWTAAGAEGIDLRSDRLLSAQATVGGATRTLTLTRVAAGDPPPFARLLREPDPPTPLPTVTPVPTAAPPAPSGSPVPVPAPVPVAGKASVSSRRLAVSSSSRVAVVVRCAGQTACRGTVRLRTAAKVRLGKRSRVVTLTASGRYSLAAGKSATVRLRLTSAGRSVMRARKLLRVRVELRPSGGKVAARTLTLRR
jgi:hypothetical protein